MRFAGPAARWPRAGEHAVRWLRSGGTCAPLDKRFAGPAARWLRAGGHAARWLRAGGNWSRPALREPQADTARLLRGRGSAPDFTGSAQTCERMPGAWEGGPREVTRALEVAAPGRSPRLSGPPETVTAPEPAAGCPEGSRVDRRASASRGSAPSTRHQPPDLRHRADPAYWTQLLCLYAESGATEFCAFPGDTPRTPSRKAGRQI